MCSLLTLLLIVVALTPARSFLHTPAAFLPPSIPPPSLFSPTLPISAFPLCAIKKDRRDQLGLGAEDDEYDLQMALDNNTDRTIVKIVAAAAFVSIVGGLVVGVLLPLLDGSQASEGFCVPAQNGGRC
jgi:hypothetical protein